MSAIKTVALAGASGNLGPAILNALLAAGTFEVTIITREGGTATFPPGVKVIPVDYTSIDSLTNAFRGQDAVVSTLGMLAMPTQTLMIDAAIAAGVKRFIPSEFGSNTYNPKSRALPVFHSKIVVQEYLEKKSKETSLTYTPIVTSGFFDWGLQMGFFVNFKERKATLYDGGDRPFSVTRLSTIGAAVVGILTHPEETKNRPVYVHEAVITQNQLIKIAQEVAPGEKWETQVVSTEKLEKEANKSLAGPEEKRKPYLMVSPFRLHTSTSYVPSSSKHLGPFR
jgi:nucleoside-diphosphate-sugar epimerase